LICSSSCKCEEEGNRVDPFSISLREWEEFTKGPFWGALLFEIEERDKYLMELLRYGDPEKKWTDSDIRSRISELEYLKTLPVFIIRDIQIASLEGEREKGE